MCTPNQVFCSADGKTIQTCSADGLGSTSIACGFGTVCSAGSCVTQVCKAQTLVCKAGQVAQCNATGSAATALKSCDAGKTCIDGACVSSVCGPGTKLCDSDAKLMTCQTDGLGWQATPCSAGKVCVGGACKQTVCVPSALICSGNDVHQCASDGTGSTLLKACAAGTFCSGGACASTLCQAGATKCDGDDALTCNANGSAWVTKSCGLGQQCQSGGCAAKLCTETAKTSGTTATPVDLVTFIDTSGSMGVEAKTFTASLNSLTSGLNKSAIDWHIVVIEQDTSCCKVTFGDLYNGRLKHLNLGVYSTDGLKKLISYYPQYSGHLRTGAKLHFLAVTDDESSGMTAAQFEAALFKLQNPSIAQDFTFHSIVAFGPLAQKGCATGAKIGQQYLSLTAKTGGLKQAVCDASWSSLFGDLLQTMTAQGSAANKCSYGLPTNVTSYGPAQAGMKVQLAAGGQTQTFVAVKDAAACGTSQGYYLTPASQPTHLVLCEYACVSGAGQPLTLTYPCP